MKISQETISVLKNFSTINSNLLVQPGNTLTTISPTKNILAEAKVEEEFPLEFGIWDLSKFLATLSMFKDPSLDFQNNYVSIYSEGSRAKVKYFYSNTEMLDPQILAIVKNGKKFKMPASVVDFTLKEKDFIDMQKASAVLAAPDLALRNFDNRLTMNVFDRKDPTSHNYSIDVGEYQGEAAFEFLFKAENLRLISGTYEVAISDKKVSQFQNGKNLTYSISLEIDSKYSEEKSKKRTHVSAS